MAENGIVDTMVKNDYNIIDTVIKNDYCIGCGACSYVNPNYKIDLDNFGMLKASHNSPPSETPGIENRVCPFSNESKNEDQIADLIYPEVENRNQYLGKYIENYVGYVDEGAFREKGSSGGFGKWILHELLQRNKVDYVVQVVSQVKENELFTYQIFKKGDDILNGSKSAYYPVTLAGALEFIKKNEGRYALTAIPCFSKALRNLCLHDETLNSRIKFVIGIICGHLKSTAFAELLGWQLDVKPKSIRGIEFRGKIKGLQANDKGVYAIDHEGKKSITKSSKQMLGGNWGYNFFKYKACDYCDDIVGETTDVSIGDAWLDDYMDDHEGNNVLIVRNKEIHSLIVEGLEENRLKLNTINANEVIKSQQGGISHRREGLSYRLFLKDMSKDWYPIKRIVASDKIPDERKKVYLYREKLRESSHLYFKNAKDENSLKLFGTKMQPLLYKYKKKSFFHGLKLKLKHIIKGTYD